MIQITTYDRDQFVLSFHLGYMRLILNLYFENFSLYVKSAIKFDLSICKPRSMHTRILYIYKTFYLIITKCLSEHQWLILKGSKFSCT